MLINAQEIDIDSLKTEIKNELKLENAIENANDRLLNWSKFNLRGYGVLNYYNYDYDTDPTLRDKIDAERLNLYLTYDISPSIEFKSEIEFEHGGTGSTIELDTQEEFGEYEQEIEAGGGVTLEQVNLNFKLSDKLNVRVGRFKMYFGLAQNLDLPNRYFTTHRQQMQNAIIPIGWYENGVDFHGKLFNNRLHYHLSFVNGLDATGFNSRNFIKLGHQKRFEMVNAESFASMLRLDYKFGENHNTYFGVAGYIGNTSPNRPKNDMKANAYLSMAEAHITYDENRLRFNGMVLYGHLQNSDVVTRLNASLSNNLGVKRTPVAKAALGAEFEIGYDVMPFFKPETHQKLYPFARVDYYDTMFQTRKNVVKKPRWERLAFTGGFNWMVHPNVVFKAHYQNKTLGSENIIPSTLEFTGKKQKDNTFSLGVGFNF